MRTGVLRYSAIALTVSLCSCGVSQDTFRKENRRLENSIADLRGIQADHTAQLDALRADIRTMLGRVEEMDFSQRQRLGSEFESLKTDLSKLKKRVPPPAVVPTSALETDESFVGRLPGDVSVVLTEGLQKVREGAFLDAVPLFQRILSEQTPGDALPMALFWSGIAYEGAGEHRNALQSFNDLTSRFPKHRRAPLGLLRLAGVFVRLGDTATAKLTYSKLIAEFPKSEEAGIAKSRLKTL